MALPDCGGFALCWLVVRITDASTRRILTVEEKVKCAIVTVAMPSRPNFEALQNGKKKSLEIRKRDNGLWQCCIRDFSGTFSKVD